MLFFEFLMRIGQNVNNIILPNLKHKMAVCWNGSGSSRFLVFSEKEREILLSRFLGDPTVGICRDKKESRSTHRDLRVGSSFGSF